MSTSLISLLVLGIVLEHMAPGMTIAAPNRLAECMRARIEESREAKDPEVEDREPEAASTVAGSAEREEPRTRGRISSAISSESATSRVGRGDLCRSWPLLKL